MKPGFTTTHFLFWCMTEMRNTLGPFSSNEMPETSGTSTVSGQSRFHLINVTQLSIPKPVLKYITTMNIHRQEPRSPSHTSQTNHVASGSRKDTLVAHELGHRLSQVSDITGKGRPITSSTGLRRHSVASEGRDYRFRLQCVGAVASLTHVRYAASPRPAW